MWKAEVPFQMPVSPTAGEGMSSPGAVSEEVSVTCVLRES